MEVPGRRMCAAMIEYGTKRFGRWQVLHSQFAAARSVEGQKEIARLLYKSTHCQGAWVFKRFRMESLLFWSIELHRPRTLPTSSVCRRFPKSQSLHDGMDL